MGERDLYILLSFHSSMHKKGALIVRNVALSIALFLLMILSVIGFNEEVSLPSSAEPSSAERVISILPVEEGSLPEQSLPTGNAVIELPVEEEELEPNLVGTTIKLILDKISYFVGEIIGIKAILTLENQTPLPDKKIDFYAQDYIGSDITNKEGVAEIFWNSSLIFPNSYVIVANYSGEEGYAPSSMGANVLINENVKSKDIPSKKKFKVKDEEGNSISARLKVEDNFVEEFDEGNYNLTVLPSDYSVSKIEFRNIHISDEVNFGLSTPNITAAGDFEFTKTYALNPEGIVFEKAVVTSIAQGETLYKCKEWDFTNSLCLGTWEEMMNLTLGKEYSFILTAIDPGFAEGHLRNIPLPSVAAHVLARVFNQDNLDYDRGYAQEYLSLRHNFSDLPYREVNDREDFSLTMGNKPNDVGGFSINNSRFAVHVVYCDGFAGFCKFRVNGVLTPQLYFSEKLDSGKTDSFDLDGNYVLTIKSAQFELCDNHRFCHLGYEGYDKVDAMIERKGR